ncbi:MAG: aspartate aminotransferase family protein [Bacteroidales bacterium]
MNNLFIKNIYGAFRFFVKKHMLTNRQIFFEHIAQTTPEPMGLEITHAKGIYLYDKNNTEYIDLVSGVSVSNLGHLHPKVTSAITEQLEKYMHLMVYGDFIQAPQVKLAKKLSDVLPDNLNCTYFVNSGSEAIDGALKLAKRCTGRREIIAFKNAYHGGTHGALSILGNEEMKNAFRPLLPDIRQLRYNNIKDLEQITEKTACVVVEPIQAEAGIILPENNFLEALNKRCKETGSLLIFDEIQMGFGRTGELFAFQKYNVTPDILCLAKAMGGGMPIGAFISSKENMSKLTYNPMLGHITTFGGHPVCCAAALASLNTIIEEKLPAQAEKKGKLFEENLINHPQVKTIRRVGLMLAVELKNHDSMDAINLLIKDKLIVDPFLFNMNAFRIAPPLIITEKEIEQISETITKCLDSIS